MSATNRGAKRRPNDFYATPDYTVDSLFQFIKWNKMISFFEPCKGDGAIYDKVPGNKHKFYTELSEGKDYFEYKPYNKFDLIVTNPPFSLAKEFLDKSLTEAHTVCYLLRLNFLGAQVRNEWWNQIRPPEKLIVLSRRPKFINNQADATEYAWFCWDNMELIDLPKGIHVVM